MNNLKPKAKAYTCELIIPVLSTLSYAASHIHEAMASPAAINLLLGTMAVESNFGQYLKQFTGPALGPYQMEPATLISLHEDYLNYRAPLLELINDFKLNSISLEQNLTYNFFYATALTRIKYWQAPDPLPLADDIEGLAHYWKKFYNTEKGRGTVEHFMEKFNKYVLV